MDIFVGSSFELDEAEGFILLGRRREKDFPSTWALLAGEDAHLLACIFAGRRRARAVSSVSQQRFDELYNKLATALRRTLQRARLRVRHGFSLGCRHQQLVGDSPRSPHRCTAQGVLPCVDPVLQSQGLAEPDARSLVFIRITGFSNIVYKKS